MNSTKNPILITGATGSTGSAIVKSLTAQGVPARVMVRKPPAAGTFPADVDTVIERAMAIEDRPVVVDFIVHRDAMVWPMVAAGTSNDEIMFARDVRPSFDEDDL